MPDHSTPGFRGCAGRGGPHAEIRTRSADGRTIDSSSVATLLVDDRPIKAGVIGHPDRWYSLAARLTSLGYGGACRSPAETAICAYARWGSAFLDRMEDRAVLAMWDGGLNRLMLAQGRLSDGRLVYRCTRSAIVFDAVIPCSPRVRGGTGWTSTEPEPASGPGRCLDPGTAVDLDLGRCVAARDAAAAGSRRGDHVVPECVRTVGTTRGPAGRRAPSTR